MKSSNFAEHFHILKKYDGEDYRETSPSMWVFLFVCLFFSSWKKVKVRNNKTKSIGKSNFLKKVCVYIEQVVEAEFKQEKDWNKSRQSSCWLIRYRSTQP